MNNKNLDELLKSMPSKRLDPSKKDDIHQSIMDGADKHERQSQWKRKRQSFVAIGGSFAVIALAFMILVLPNMDTIFTGDEEPVEIPELEKFDHAFYLPTYAPFDIHEVEYDHFYFGAREIKDDEVVYTQEDNPDYLLPKVVYFSHTDPVRKMDVSFSRKSEHGSYDEIEDYDERVMLEGGIEAKYDETSHDRPGQMIAWEYDDLLIQLSIRSIEEPVSRDDMIQIAESFEKYEVGSADEHSFLQNQIQEFEGLSSLGEETTQQIREHLDDAIWDGTTRVNMQYPPNYVLDEYRIWIHPQQDRIDVINTDNGDHAELGEAESDELYELITGDTLGSDS
ncbi:hypothetical protein ABID56_000996 [Alkalibacillus flavidus]|uniref:DUF4367 domain-containing protein n=1 Tax=Alkalibacillus flavidus TaxID=546021 RepID=A0ABV2KTJ5_9BACI